MTDSISIERHNEEIKRNLDVWQSKPILRAVYGRFYKLILNYVNRPGEGSVIEIGSGIGGFKEFYPNCVATDIFPNPWIDKVMSAYELSFPDSSASSIILFDVFHHLAFPGSALNEFNRVLIPTGRVIIFEPCMSLFGFLVYGLLHAEPIAIFKKIKWLTEKGEKSGGDYYSAQGNASRIFGRLSSFKKNISADWNIVARKKYSAISYVLSGGFSKPSFYGKKLLPFLLFIEKILDLFPIIFATRILVVIEKKSKI